MTLSSVPIWFVDILGSITMIIVSFLCLLLVHELRSRDRNNVIWTYLLWVCIGLAGFAISRSAGHILKQILIMSESPAVWESIRPFSGAINTMMFVLVGSVTLFFEQIWNVYRQIFKDKQALQSAHAELLYLNQNLENLVTERSKALALSEQQYRRIFEISRDMILVANKDGSIVDLNPAGYEMLGCEASDTFPTQNGFQRFFADGTDWTKLIETIEKKGFVSSYEVNLQRTDGKKMRSLVSGSMDKGSSTKEDIIHLLVKDIEQRRLIEEQISRADKLASIGQLSAGIAHEINNPLGIVLGYTQLLLRQEESESEKQRDLKTIEKHARNCKTIVEDLLNFARSSTPREDLTRIDEALEDVLKFVQQHADLDGIIINKEYDISVPEMFLDEKKIKQVFMNLIMNATHAIGNSGTLALSTRYVPATRQVFVKIEDNGHGIEKKNLSRIFDPFFTTKPTGEGTGLGLSVSYGIIKNHGGNILVESEVGKGSIFTIVLPAVSPGAREKKDEKIHSHR
ncbi:MAG: ATP-binding protein [Desulfobacterales bacterium]|jgi:PAS domain S-box-containing protein